VTASAVALETVSEADVYLNAGVRGELNLAHINETYAQNTFFKTRIAHGMLSAGFISAAIGMQLPGPGTIYMRQELTEIHSYSYERLLRPESRQLPVGQFLRSSYLRILSIHRAHRNTRIED